MKAFQYHAPGSLEEACQLLVQYGDKGRPLAGGTDLLVKMKQKVLEPDHLISLREIGGLKYVSNEAGVIRIGALTELQQIADSDVIREKLPILAEAASQVGSVQIRNRGTLGGNICNASPAADTVPPLICLGARVVIKSVKGDRETPVESFFVAPGKVDLCEGEIVRELIIPIPGAHAKGVYLKLGRRKAMDISIVGAGALGSYRNRRFETVRLALASVAPTPIRAKKTEEILRDGVVDAQRISLAAREAASECQPISDVRGSASYRREMVKVLVEKAIRNMM